MNSYIIGEIYINDYDVNRKIRIINSYEDAIKDYIKFDNN